MPENGVLWNQFLIGLASGQEESKAVRADVSVQALKHLDGAAADTLRPMVSGLCDLIRFGPRQRIADVDGWLEILWPIVSELPENALDPSTDLYDKAINSIAGRLTETLLLEMDSNRPQGIASSEVQLQLARRIAVHEETAGQLGHAGFARYGSFLLSIDRSCVNDILGPRISASSKEGAALRAVMLSYQSISPELTELLRPAVKKGAAESEQSDHEAANVAANVLRPALRQWAPSPWRMISAVTCAVQRKSGIAATSSLSD